jgi:hypothetical protein
MFLLSKPTFITMRVEDLDKKSQYEKERNGKTVTNYQCTIFIGTLAVRDQAYDFKILFS